MQESAKQSHWNLSWDDPQPTGDTLETPLFEATARTLFEVEDSPPSADGGATFAFKSVHGLYLSAQGGQLKVSSRRRSPLPARRVVESFRFVPKHAFLRASRGTVFVLRWRVRWQADAAAVGAGEARQWRRTLSGCGSLDVVRDLTTLHPVSSS